MEVERTIDPAARVVTLTVIGDLGDAELMSLADVLAETPDLEPDFSLLIDLRQAHGEKVTSAGVYRLVERPLVLSPASRRAVVVPTNLGFGMARMYETLRSNRGGGARVFRDYEEARRWVTAGTGIA
jgi:hypothetical protein